MKDYVQSVISHAASKISGLAVEVEVSRSPDGFGDFSSNIAMKLSGQLKRPPREIAERIIQELDGSLGVEIAGPGFINVTVPAALADRVVGDILAAGEAYGSNDTWKDKQVIVEYSDPNPFKVLHAGHLYTSIVGDAIASLFEVSGARVHRVNFGGDVGRHVAQTMWAMLREFGGEKPEKLASIPEGDRSEWMARCYVTGTQAFEADEVAKQEIIALNKRVYELHDTNDHDSPFAQIYWTTRQWSYDYFDAFYARIGTTFEKYYPESAVAQLGLDTVREQLKAGVFTKSDGAVVFDGETLGLHTRVFINSEGLPTYEAKDVGLIMQKWRDYGFDKSVVITANEQEQYMTVVLKAIQQFAPELAERTTHLTHGIVKLEGGVKMSSRKGNFLRAVDVLDSAAAASQEQTGNSEEASVLAAVKYSFLRTRMGGDIVYDPKESVSILGNSGPYLQYAHARACSILRKSTITGDGTYAHDDAERPLVMKLSEYPEIVHAAVQACMPHIVCTYLYELAQTFNAFYEKNRVIGDQREPARVQLIKAYTTVLKNGLNLLGIEAPDKM